MLFNSLYRFGTRTFRSADPETLLVLAVFHIPMTLIFAVILLKSMSWELVLDCPMFMYSGFLMDHFGMVPVRDFFTYNMIGTHVIFRWLYHFFGGSILGMRLADTTILAVILALFARVLKPFGFRVAWAGVVSFGILHITCGLHGPLQRDYIALVPLQLAILSATVWFESNPRVRWIATGFFVGALSTIKPHLMLGGPVLYGYLLLDTRGTAALDWRAWTARAVRIACWCACGGCIPVLWMAAYLAYYGQLTVFVNVLIGYFPLHNDIKYSHTSNEHRIFEDGEALPYIAKHAFDYVAWTWRYQLALGTGTGLALFIAAPTVPKGLRKYGGLLAVLTLAYFLYPISAKRFYHYHYYPFSLLISIWAAFCLYRWSSDTALRVRLCGLGVAAYVFAGMVYANYDTLQTTPTHGTGGYYRTVRIAQWLRTRLEPGDTVQGIEWASCGIAHAFLELQAKPATHTIWGEVLSHHISNPFLKDYRRTFMEQLKASRPRFIVVSRIRYDYVVGRDCGRDFPELEAFLSSSYVPALESNDFRIWESNTSPTAARDRERHDQSTATPVPESPRTTGEN